MGKRKVAKKAKPKAGVRKAAKPSKAPKAESRKPKTGGAWDAVFTQRELGERRYWLVKSEPDTFSFDDLLRIHNKTTHWDNIRNFVARNFMRDGMKTGDRVFFYHSSNGDPGIVGICEVVREAYPDAGQFDPASDYYDAKATKEKPIWYMVDIRAVAQMTKPVPLTAIKTRKELKNMALLRIGRLSVTPVTLTEWNVITSMADSL
jgi:predicted RNA-binding protein with PUA-like domain